MLRVTGKLCVAVGVFALIVGVAWAEDEIERKSAKLPLRGTITGETANEIAIQRKDTGKIETVPLNDVARVKYEKVFIDFQNAEASARNGDFPKAAELYEKVAQQSAGKQFALRAANFGRVHSLVLQAQRDPAKIDEAIQALEEFRTQNPDSRYHYAVHETLGRLQLAKQNEAAARAAFAELARAPWPETKLKATLYEGRLLVLAGQYDQAIAKFDEVAKTAGDSSEEKLRAQEAQVGKAECLVKQKKHTDAEKFLRDVIDSASSDESGLQAAAFNLLGDVQRETGKPKEAIFSYLYVDFFYSGERDEHAKSLCYIALLWEQIGRPDRAEEARSRLKGDYPNSPWVKVAAPQAKAE